MTRAILLVVLFAAGCDSPSAHASLPQAPSVSPLEGTYEYVGNLKGQAMLDNGRYVFVYGAAYGATPPIGDAGTYQITRDTATGKIAYSTDPGRVGTTFKWSAESWSADTLSYVLLDARGQVTGRGRAVRRH